VLFTLCIPDSRAKKSTLLAKIQLQPIHHAMKTPTLASPPRGFALVITLLLMIILTVVAVGLLSLSTISIRTSGQAQAMATARGNARLALMMALGDLQKTIGPDRAVTANSAILVDTQKFNTTGVWESWWDFDPNSSSTPDYVAQKRDRFRRWLVSSPNPTDTQERDFAITPWTGQQITLVGGGSLGTGNTGPAQAVAGLVPVTAGKSKGAYAWHVADESIKARVNLYRDPTKNSTLAEKCALLAGHRPDPSVIKDTNTKLDFLPTDTISSNGAAENNFDKATKISQKITNLGQLDLVNTGGGSGTNNAEKIKPFRNDITPYSLGVLTDVRHGGLKQDLSSVFEMSTGNNTNLPSEFNGNRLYQSTLGLTGESDPYWSTLSEYYNSFKNLQTSNKTILPLKSTTTERNTKIRDGNNTKLTPKEYQIGPVINKVEVIFSLIAREATSTWMGKFETTAVAKFEYTVNLVFSPRITLHNPYNIPITFKSTKLELDNVPVGFRFSLIRSGSSVPESQSINPSGFESLNEMIERETNPKGDYIRHNKKFVVFIGDWRNTDPYASNKQTVAPIVMNPGQTMTFKAFIDPNATFQKDSDNGENTKFFDWLNQLSPTGIKLKSGSIPDLGFEINTITPSQRSGDWGWFLLLKKASNPAAQPDKFFVEYKIKQPEYFESGILNKIKPATFNVDAYLENDSGSFVDYAKLEFDYHDDKRLQEISSTNTMRSPADEGLSYTGLEIFEPAVKLIKDQKLMKKFATFSAYSRTTNSGVYETGERIEKKGSLNTLKDGRVAGKPFLFHSQASTVYPMDLAKSPSLYPYELNLQEYEQLSNDDLSRNPALTGNTNVRGIKSGSYLEIPIGPLQTIADFRRSNTLTSPYLPQLVQPVGNSLLHPSLSSNKINETNTNVAPYPLFDHSFIANHALYDRFYFSTFATRGNDTPNVTFDQFMGLLDSNSAVTNNSPLLNQSFTPYLPAGKTTVSAKADLFSGSKPNNNAYQKAAEYQMIQGPFNVNSTNVQAWKAVLAAMSKNDVSILWAKNATLLTTPATSNNDKIPVHGMSLPNGNGSSSNFDVDKIDNKRTNDWNGYRELTPAELEILATKIVDQVRLRGPFLSMSEFVNRQIGPVSELSLSGALEKAIADSEINKDFLSGSVTDLKEEHFTNAALYNYKTPRATIGNPAAGAPGWVSQGDLMHILEPAATVRSDTFVIRVCGEAKDSNGSVTARAYAEAVVQRVPEYVDPVDRPSLNAYDQTLPINVTSSASIINKTFGRRINVVSFRWLSNSEI
jgi:type II secretory pathway pseudopilin PulG